MVPAARGTGGHPRHAGLPGSGRGVDVRGADVPTQYGGWQGSASVAEDLQVAFAISSLAAPSTHLCFGCLILADI